MNILNVSAECYPAAKAGGLADVVGALPKYMNKYKVNGQVVIPKYDMPWFRDHAYETVFEAEGLLGYDSFQYRIQKVRGDDQVFELYVADIPGYFDRPTIYLNPATGLAYNDEFERNLTFQLAVLGWVDSRDRKPDILHCHDHHTGLIPFMVTHCQLFNRLKNIPTVLTIHNGQYQGVHSMSSISQMPAFDSRKIGLLDWNGLLNCLASGIKCAWRVTAVSPSYMEELQQPDYILGDLLRSESAKCNGIINGIDTDVWNPATDEFTGKHFSVKNVSAGKKENKHQLCTYGKLKTTYPLISYIGRFALEKGADMLPDLIDELLGDKIKASFVILGSGDQYLERRFRSLAVKYPGSVSVTIEYNERLSHLIYAGSDYLIMPSRVEPCGLNQLYAMRYGTIPIVRGTGGLKDTVPDVAKGGFGIRFNHFNLEEAFSAVQRALNLYRDKNDILKLRRLIMNQDFSWDRSVKNYLDLYKQLKSSIQREGV